MFRELVRKKQRLERDEIVRLLLSEKRGVLSLNGDDGYPYAVPMNFLYDEESGNIFFHSGKRGHKIDALEASDKVSFCVLDGGFVKEGEWALNIKSVVAFGRMRVVEDEVRAMDICRRLSLKFTDDTEYIESEIARFGANTLCLELCVEHITGKIVNES
jgi:nitroimidazol reductase NimA-like FMN-containing flavoprotein (pyridoxamine 5'-phosphate oxidase superfamily)